MYLVFFHRLFYRIHRVDEVSDQFKAYILLLHDFSCSFAEYLTIGLSSVKRKRGNYLLETIKSIFDQSSYEELKEIVVVVHLADFDLAWCESLVQEISRKFGHHIIAGRLLVIHAPEEYYPSLNGLKRNYNDPEDRVRFRSKQNVDYAFLLNFCTNLSDFYMMLEDDVRCSRNFLTALKKVVASREGSYWVMLEFSKLGYIGKLYHSRDLPDLPISCSCSIRRCLAIGYNPFPRPWPRRMRFASSLHFPTHGLLFLL